MEPVNDTTQDTATRYRDFARVDARGQSPRYEAWASGIADAPHLIALIDELPVPKRQVNLVFAAARMAGAPNSDVEHFSSWLEDHWEQVREIALSHATQTNEVARCAVLLPLLAALPQPLALIEVGASAGLCLYPERYSYRFGDSVLHPQTGPSPVTLEPTLHGPVPVPRRMPQVVWRAGIDLNPLDVNSADDRAWLEALVWPEHDERRVRLRSALDIVRREPPRIERANALEALPALAAEAPDGATLVVFHSAVLAYFSADERSAFVRMMGGLDGHWISNEGLTVIPAIQDRLAEPAPDPALFLLAQDGAPVAFAGGHGQSLSWMS